MLNPLKWLGIGGLLVLGVSLWRAYDWARRKIAHDKEVEAAVERSKADAVKAEPVPTDLNEVKRILREKGKIN